MKHYFLFLIGLLLSIHSLNTNACDAVFDGGMVRYNWSYNFFDDFIAPNKDSFMNTYSIDYVTPQFLDASASIGTPFNWTQTLRNNLYKVPANTRMRILENGTNKLRIAGVPPTRTNGTTSSYDFGIKYTIVYDYSNNYPNASDDISHQECVYYSVSWCGDGVIDSSFSETCDNGALNGTAGNTCSSTCTVITPPASCTSGGVTGAQTSAVTSTTTGLCSAGVTAVGNFASTVSGNTTSYSWSCGGLTGGNCSASYTSTTPASCTSGGITGAQTSTISSTTTGLCSTGVVVGSFASTVSGNTTSYSWSCGGLTGGNCSASYTPTGGGGSSCTSGGVTGAQTSTITSTTTGLCSSGVAVGSFASTVSGNTTSYSWSCNGLTGGNCSASYTPGGGGGGSSSVCTSLTQTKGTGDNYSFTCNGNSTQYTIDINKLNNDGSVVTPAITTFTNAGGSYNFTGNGTYKIQCYVGSTNSTSTACTKNITIGGGGITGVGGFCGNGIIESGETCDNGILNGTAGNICRSDCTYCGDGILQETQGEQCDFGTHAWENWCIQNTCKIKTDTIPGGYSLRFEPSGKILLGDGMNIFGNLSSSFVKINNSSASDVFFNEKVCVYKVGENVIDGGDYCTSSIIGTVTKGITKTIGVDLNTHFTATTDNLGMSKYGDAQLITTLNGYKNIDTFLKATLDVRVAKPTVGTLGGGASLLNGNNLSDINTLSTGGFALLNPAKNKNLILSSLGVNPLSSYVKKTSNSNLIDISKEQGNAEINNFTGVTSNLGSITINNLPNVEFNGFDTVFIHKGNVNLGSDLTSSLTGNTTYVIEGDLNINNNLTSSKNILFVVKSGNIIINNNVTNIDAILINIGGNISGESTSTLNRLVVNGALYGDVSSLLSKRTYIKDRGEYVDVGTNINFTSKIFNSPPPLLSSFLGEYTESKKVPQ